MKYNIQNIQKINVENMNKLIVILILLADVLFSAGCTEDNDADENVPNTQETSIVSQEVQQEESTVVNVTELEQINTSLQQGPVLVKIGAEWCGPCQAMKPILKDLADEYNGKVTIMSIDIDQSSDLAAYFEIGYVPDTSLIVGIEDGDYLYMKEDGSVTKDRLQARILGQMDKKEYEDRINIALLQEGKSVS